MPPARRATARTRCGFPHPVKQCLTTSRCSAMLAGGSYSAHDRRARRGDRPRDRVVVRARRDAADGTRLRRERGVSGRPRSQGRGHRPARGLARPPVRGGARRRSGGRRRPLQARGGGAGMSAGWVLLAFAIATEVVGTVALRASHGLTRALPLVVCIVAYVLSFALLALTLKHLSLGTTYAIWSGVGTVAIAAIGRIVYHELITAATAAGIALVIGGVLLIHLGGGVTR